jgi:hypothetical protein
VLAYEELSDVSGSAGQLFADVETYTFVGLWSSIGACLCILSRHALGLSGAADLAFQMLGGAAWSLLGTWIWKQGEIDR